MATMQVIVVVVIIIVIWCILPRKLSVLQNELQLHLFEQQWIRNGVRRVADNAVLVHYLIQPLEHNLKRIANAIASVSASCGFTSARFLHSFSLFTLHFYISIHIQCTHSYLPYIASIKAQLNMNRCIYTYIVTEKFGHRLQCHSVSATNFLPFSLFLVVVVHQAQYS